MNRGTIAALLGVALTLVGPGVAQAAAPANDDFAAAAPLAVEAEISSSNVDATAQAGEPDPAGPSHSSGCTTPADGPQCSSSVWYSFQPAVAGEYTIETCDAGTEPDTTLGAYTGTLGALALVKENDNGALNSCPGGPFDAGTGSRISFTAIGGTLYRIYVGGRVGEEGSFWLRSYPGPTQLRPAPDTGVAEETSFARWQHGQRVGPSVRSGPRHSASLALETTPPETPVECSLDGGAFAACGPAVSYDDLAPGSSHVIQVRANAGGAIDPTPLVHRFTLDSTPPETTIVSGPSGPLASQEATWTLAGSERANHSAPFACGIDSMPLGGCGRTKKYTGLCQGPHGFRAAAVDLAYNTDPSPATAQIEVTTGPACAAPTVGEPSAPVKIPTELVFPAPYDTKGAGGLLQILYGKTTSYGMEIRGGVEPSALPYNSKISIQQLEPGTTYHYKIVVTTPFGTASSADQTATTAAVANPLPSIQNGEPAVAGRHAVSLPVTIDSHGEGALYRLFLATGSPVPDDNSARFTGEDTTKKAAGSETRVLAIQDLDPATTYYYRFSAEGLTSSDEALGPEGTFTTPPYPTLPTFTSTPTKPRFKLRRRQVKVGKLTRRSQKLVVRIRGLPVGSKAKLRLKVGGNKQFARKKARRSGRVRFKMTLSKRIRKALRDRTVKRFRLKVTALPPNEAPSSITVTKRIKP